MDNRRLLGLKRTKSQGKNAFILAFALSFLILLPFLIKDGGIFVLYGDYNVQQIPFYQLAHSAVRNGNLFWNWNTDLGVNFLGSYSFYLLYSPFFWLTLPFPNTWVPYLMAPLLILKTASAAFTAYLYLERFVKDKTYALIGAQLYAFSGWMFFNIFFNHFHEVAVFFPLLLLALEKLVTENKKLLFALAVAATAMVNYWFFVGEVVFVTIYIIVRSYNKDWGITLKRFGRIVVESILGLALSMIATLPSVMALLGNPRADADRLLNGWSFWIYYHNFSDNGSYPQRFFAILQSLFFPPDLVARPNFFPNHGAQWASLSAWLPLFGLVGVIAFFIQNKNKPSWLKKILPLCLFMALIPGFNSLFVALNSGYYARWFFMPILLMTLATTIALEKSSTNIPSFYAGIKWVFIISTGFAIACGLTPKRNGSEWSLGLAKDLELVLIWYIIVAVGLLILFVLMKFRNKSFFKPWLIGGLSFIIVAFGVTYLFAGKTIYPRRDEVVNTVLGNQGKFNLPDKDFVRSDIYDDTDNLLMSWDLPGIQAFHSIVPPSVIDFYNFVGVERNEASRPETKDFPLRSLLSVRWLFIADDNSSQSPMPDYTLFENQNGYNIYENDNFIPMGSTYDYYITREQLESVSKEDRTKLMLRALTLGASNEPIANKLSPLPKEEFDNINTANYLKDCIQRKESTVDSFKVTKTGFVATSSFSEPKIVFFSVPYDKGWSASINGKEAIPITKANIGFMAIEVPKGECVITFNYIAPGLEIGSIISIVTATMLFIYWLVIRKKDKISAEKMLFQKDWQADKPTTLSWDEFLARYDKAEIESQVEKDILEAKKAQIIKLIEEKSKEG